MKQRAFGNSGITVSEVGLGCWQLGGSDWGGVSEGEALATLQAALDHGVTFFDMADVYGLDRSERIIDRFLESCPAEVVVATKFGRFPRFGASIESMDEALFCLEQVRPFPEGLKA